MNVVRRWWRRRRAARHEPWCPVAFAFVPTWAVNPSGMLAEDRIRIVHPPAQCAGCPTDIWWYTLGDLSKRKRLYCSPECRHRAGNPEPARPRAQAPAPPSEPMPPDSACPRPDKLAFLTEEDAAARFTALLLTDPSFHVYLCPGCLLWHGGHLEDLVDEGQQIAAIARFGRLRRPA